ncbi:hypothetical protein [Acinetobacter sp. ANC 4639]
MLTLLEPNLAPEIVSNVIDRLSLTGPFRKGDAKSTFFVSPRLHRKLDLVCECTGLTRQEIYTKALREYLNGNYLKDIDPELFKTNVM